MITIRKAAASDSGEIASVHIYTWRDTYAGVIPEHVLLNMSHRQHAAMWSGEIGGRRNGQVVLVAEDSHAGIVGFGSCGRGRHTNLPYEGEVYTLYVHPNFQGQGIGKGLLGQLFGVLLDRRLRSALVWVLADNPARFFYQAMGGKWTAVREERLWRTSLPEMAYGWGNLKLAVSHCQRCSGS